MTPTIPMPGRRLGTRLVLPLAISFSAAIILAWSSWRVWVPLTVVRATPVILRAAQSAASPMLNMSIDPSPESAPMVQAPGWVEPSPFPIAASALISGVVREVLVLEGDRVEKNQVVATLIDDQEKLALRSAEAEVLVKAADVAMLQDEFRRKQPLVQGGGVSAGEVARLGFKVAGAEAALAQVSAARDQAALALQRTEIRAPASGNVMARLAAPGSLVGMDAQGAAVIELFDPKNLQIRTDVPLMDAGRLRVGQRAQVQFDALPGQTVMGRVARLVQQADIAKNTLQAKVILDDPPAGIVPDMLARVRILLTTESSESSSSTAGAHGASSRTELVVPDVVVASAPGGMNELRKGTIRVVVDIRDGVGRIESRDVTCGPSSSGWTPVYSGLQPGDFVVWPDAPPTANRERVRVKLGDPTSTTEADHAQP